MRKQLTISYLKFSEAVGTAQGMEAANSISQQCQGAGAGIIHRFNSDKWRKTGRHDSKRTCYQCGHDNHLATDCHFKEATCNSCGKKGIAKAYSKKAWDKKKSYFKIPDQPLKLQDKHSDSSENERFIQSVKSRSSCTITVVMRMNSK